MTSIRRWNLPASTGTVPGVLIREGQHRTFVPHHQLATFADFMIDAFETYEQGKQQ